MNAEYGTVLKAAYPQVVATLTRVLGDIDRAMDATQDALLKALEDWQVNGIPREPVAWLVTVGRNRAIDQLRRQRRQVDLGDNVVELVHSGIASLLPDGTLRDDTFEQAVARHEIDDDLLRLIFSCCHPQLNTNAQIVLTLKVVLGFSVDEIARALLTARATIEKRIGRAKQRLRAEENSFALPRPDALTNRLAAVLRVVYLLFNEGYSRAKDPQLFRGDLCAEAIRLARIVCRLMRAQREPRALLALMLFSHARRPARLNANGEFVPLLEQDRKCWNAGSISEALALTDALFLARLPPGSYQIQAAIAALHCTAASAAETNWPQIIGLYEKLQQYEPSPVVAVNHAAAVFFAGQTGHALTLLKDLEDDPRMQKYQPFYAALAPALAANHHPVEAAAAYRRAIDLSNNAPERAWLERQLNACLPDDQ